MRINFPAKSIFPPIVQMQLSCCYRANAKVTPSFRMIVYSHIVHNTIALAHLTQERVVDVIVEVAKRYFLRQNRTDIVLIVLETYAQNYILKPARKIPITSFRVLFTAFCAVWITRVKRL